MHNTPHSKQKVGFIGIGAMGAPMSKNLMRAGFPLIVYDVRTEAMDAISKEGANIASSPFELAKSSDVIITMLPSSSSLKEVVYGEEGLLTAVGKGQTFIEMSTIGLALTLQLANSIEQRGAAFLDSPVGGIPEMAETRDLEILVSGKRECVDGCMELLGAIGKKVIYVGKVGNGKIIKLTNNLLIALNKLAAIEATSVALKHGIDPDLLLEVVKQSSGNSAVFERFGRTIVGYETSLGKKHSWHLKDLELVQELCREGETPLFFGNLARKIIHDAARETGGEENLESMIQFYRKVARGTEQF